MRTTTVTLLFAVLVAMACRTSGNDDSRGVSPAGAIWTETVDLRLDEMFVADGRALEVRPVSVETLQATLLVRVRGLVMALSLHAGTGPLSSHTVYPYRFELLSTTLEPSVQLKILRLAR